MTQYRVLVARTFNEPPVCAYGGRSVIEAVYHGDQYLQAHTVKVQYKHKDGSWRNMTSREGHVYGLRDSVDGVPGDVVCAGHDSWLGY